MKTTTLRTLVTVLFSTIIIIGNSQDAQVVNLLETNSTWQKEIFTFPLSFAKSINYEGVEEAQFPIGWTDETHTNFWSYVFAWDIYEHGQLSTTELERDLQKYFNGLMNIELFESDPSSNKRTRVKLTGTTSTPTKTTFQGYLTTYDAFLSQSLLRLNLVIDRYECGGKNHFLYVFRLSPKNSDDIIWNTLKEAIPNTEILEK